MKSCSKFAFASASALALVFAFSSGPNLFAQPAQQPAEAAQQKQAPEAPAKELQSNEPGTTTAKSGLEKLVEEERRNPKPKGKVFQRSEGALDWAQWRGPQRTGILPKQDWPDKLDGKLERMWSIKMGPSYSGPLVVGDFVYSTETVDKKWEVIRCCRRSDGTRIWRSTWEGAIKVPMFARANGSWIRATPIHDNGRIYVVGIRDMIKCLDAKSGRELWKVNFVKRFETNVPAFGAVTSPMIDGDFLYTQAASAFFKINKKSGDIIWKTLRSDDNMMSGGSFSSPVIAEINGVRQAVVATRTKLAGVDLETGDVLWEQPIKTFRGMNILTPIVVGNQILISAYSGSTQMFQIDKAESGMASTEVWSNGTKAYMSTPVVIDGHAYMFLQNQRLACIDLKTGKETFRTSQRFGKYASMIGSGDKILALDEDGTLMLIKANPETFELIDKTKVCEDSWAHLAISGDEIVIRELEAITSYKWSK